MGRLKKHNSKRQTLRTKYKIQKKVKEHKKKLKKAAKKNPHKQFKTRRDPGIPSDWPFKESLLAEIEKAQAAQQAADAAKRAAKKERQQAKANPATLLDSSILPPSLTTPTPTPPPSSSSSSPHSPSTTRSHQTLRILRQLISSSSLLLFALDARDPQGSRWPSFERRLAATPNAPPLVFVLTHCDLIPSSVLAHWLAHLSLSHPTLAFITDHALDSPTSKPQPSVLRPLPRPTTDVLIDLVRGYRVDGGAKQVSVAVLGFDNTGKSSLCNALMRTSLCGVSEVGGYTKEVRRLHVTDTVKLMDSPGIPSMPQHPGPHITLPLEQAKETISALVDALEPAMVSAAFSCPSFTSPSSFLDHLASKMGKYMKGGMPNQLSAARQLVRQWNAGKVLYYVYPPEVEEGGDGGGGKGGVGEAGEGLGRMFEEANRKVVEGLRAREEEEGKERHYIVLDDSLFAAGEEEEGEEGEEEEGEGEGRDEEEEEEEGGEEEEGMEEIEEEDDTAGGEAMEAEEEQKQEVGEDVESEVFLNPSPQPRGRTRQSRPRAVSTSKAPPLLTPSKTQRRLQEEREREEKQRGEEEATSEAMEEEEAEVSEPDSPAKHTRSRDRMRSSATTVEPATRRTRGAKAAGTKPAQAAATDSRVKPANNGRASKAKRTR